MPELAHRILAPGRLRQAGIAIAVAALVSALTILRPLDISAWTAQSKLFAHQPSTEIIFITDESQTLERSGSPINQRLLGVLKQLDTAGAERIVLDTPIRRSVSPADDRVLRDELQKLGDRVVLTRAVSADLEENTQVAVSDPYFAEGLKVVSTDLQMDFLGFVWEIEETHANGPKAYPALWNELAEGGDAERPIYPDYSIQTSGVPKIDLFVLERGDDAAVDQVRGNIAVIGGLVGDDRTVNVPDYYYGKVHATLVHILAAETAKRGSGQYVSAAVTLPVMGILLLLGLLLFHQNAARRTFYFAWVAVFALVFVLGAEMGWRMMLADPLLLGMIYAGTRATLNFRRRHLYVEPRSKLPNFVALQRDFGDDDSGTEWTIVVAKIARLDAVFATINPAEQGRYLRQVAARLTVADTAMTIYYDGGKYFAFALPTADYQDLPSHLEGLRAIASQTITVSGVALDVSMTLGVDEAHGHSIPNRISSAIAAADQAREAYRPVFIISDFEADSETWDYSLQARLEDALSEDRISIKLQPKADLQSGLFVGAEALARWSDEQRGEIPPAQFILQCERVGRLDDLTKRILWKSLSASKELERDGLPARVAVNVSAIQFVDTRIVDLVERSLIATGADPRNIIIEVTESARIENFKVAREIMERIGRSGVEFAIDDFGVASANFDALYELPFSELKIDRMFADEVTRSPSARAIVSHLAQLSKEMNLTSVAEGIESRETLESLRDLGCDLAQGFYLARPQPLAQLKETLSLQKDNFPNQRDYG